MRGVGQPDSLIIVNGPEDGSEFAIIRSPLKVGSDPTCPVCITLDPSVEEQHVLLSATAAGYRVRQAGMSPVYVDGKKAGAIRSRMLRPGSYLEVGHTVLALECAPDGLAARSHGGVKDSDVAWALMRGARWGFQIVSDVVLFFWRTFFNLATSKLGILAILILLYFFWPTFHYHVNNVFRWLLSNTLGRIMQQTR